MNGPSAFADDVWTLSGDVARMYGIPFATRATIIRLKSGGLWVHSPIVPDERHFEFLDKLGPVEHLVAPNKIHSLGILPWKAMYPEAKVWVSPMFPQRHPDMVFDGVLTDDHVPEWREEIDFKIFAGSTFLDEVVFLHKNSRTLIVTDLIQKHDPASQSWFWAAVKAAVGVLGRTGGTGRDLRATFLDRSAARRSRDHIMNWRFENLILCHGPCMRGNGKSTFYQALEWLGR